MATYKVLQDIEAEDKLVGPLTLRQFIYAAIGAVAGYICFLGITKNAYFILVIFLPIMMAAGFFAFPWKGDQPTEIWALARLRFAVKPRRRIWDQTGVKDYVTITVPKKVEVHYTNGLNQDEVRSRLHTLADVIDSRGWATKNAPYNAFVAPTPFDPNSDRLVAASGGQQAPFADVPVSDDMLDDNSTVAQNLNSMLDRSEDARRKRVVQEMTAAAQPTPAPSVAPTSQGPSLPSPIMPSAPAQPAPQPLDTTWFMNPTAPGSPPAQVITPGTAEDKVPAAAAAEPTAEEKALAEQFKEQNQAAQQISYGHLHVVQPLGRQQTAPQKTSDQPAGSSLIDYGSDKAVEEARAKQKALADEARRRAEAAVTHQRDDAIIKELSVNDDEDIATLARRASKEIRKTPEEVEIRLH